MTRPRRSTKELDTVMNAYLIAHLGESGESDHSMASSRTGASDLRLSGEDDPLLKKYAHQVYCDLHLINLCYSVVSRADHTAQQALEAASEVVSENLSQYSAATQRNLAMYCVTQWPTEDLLALGESG